MRNNAKYKEGGCQALAKKKQPLRSIIGLESFIITKLPYTFISYWVECSRSIKLTAMLKTPLFKTALLKTRLF